MKKLLFLTLTTFFLIQAKAQNWDEVIKAVASDRAASDIFGYSVSISGDYAIVGAVYEDEDATGGNTRSRAGSAYLFERDGSGHWNQMQKIVAADRAANDYFGHSVSISGDYAIVGARCENHDATGGNYIDEAGSAYLFERDGGGNWNQVQKIVASDRSYWDRFGWSVSISGDYAIVGASYEEDPDVIGENRIMNAGAAYLFERDGSGNWNQVQKIVAADRELMDMFGTSVSISGDYVIVGADHEDSIWRNRLNNAGSAYLFERDGSGHWNQVQKIVASDRAANDYFGYCVSISGDYAIVGAPLEDENSAGGNTMTSAGSAYVFERDGSGNWNQVQKIVASDRQFNDKFGWSVSIKGDYAIVGAWVEDEDTTGGNTLPNAGSAYVFEIDVSGNWNQVQKIVTTDRAAGDRFGQSVSINSDYAIVGAFWEDEDATGGNTLTRAGSAYFFKSIGNPNQVSGRVFKDDNGNCTADSTELGMGSIIVKVNPDGFYGITDSNGYFSFYTDTGTYQVSQIIPAAKAQLITQNCPTLLDDHTVDFDSVGQDTSGINFANTGIPCVFLTIDITSTRRRFCAQSSTFINYCNEGYRDTTGIQVYLKLPLYVDIISATHSYIQDGLGNYVFDIDTLRALECGTIRITDKVRCISGIMGLTQCTKVWITPANTCEPIDIGWDKSSIEVTGECTRDSIVEFTIFNIGPPGTGDMGTERQFRSYADGGLIYVDSFILAGGDSLVIQVVANGQTIRLEADQHSLHPVNSHPIDVVEACGTDSSGGFSIGFVSQQFTDDADIATEEECLPITASFDPNDKRVSPEGITANRYVKPGTLLDYVIRFQNTGTDTAYDVVVRDALPQELDVATLVLGSSSHPYELNVSGSGSPVFSFIFNDIYLPDSTTDLLNSMGYLKFKIAPLPNLPNNTVIHNEAAIFFDFNPRIITNDAWVTIHDSTIIGPGNQIIRCDTASPPVLSFGTQDTSICPGSSIGLLVSGGDSYYWYSGDSLSDRNTPYPIAYPSAAETYRVEVYSNSGCTSTKDSVRVNIHPVSTSTISPVDCRSYVSPSGNYTWTSSGTYMDTIPSTAGCDSIITLNLTINNSTSETINPIACDSYVSPSGNYIWTSSGTFRDIIPNKAGCDSTVTVNLTINNSTSATINPIVCDSYVCPSGNYTWISSGTYKDIIPNRAGCDSTITVNLTIYTIDTSIIRSGATLTANISEATYQWLDCNDYGLISKEINQRFIPTASGSYAIEIAKNGCVDTSVCFVVSVVDDEWSVYPNPSLGKYTIDLGRTYSGVTITMRSLMGQIVSDKHFERTQYLPIDIKEPAGLYLLEIRTTEGRSAMLKVLKE